MRPLSPKTIAKRFAQLGIPQEEIDLLHRYFRCFANLYGIIMIGEAWKVYRHFEGLRIHKKDFIAFSEVAKREGDMPYTIIEGSELYTDDDFEEEDPDLRQIIDNRLIIKGRDKYLRAYVTQLEQGEKEWFLPDSREDMLRFEEDQFYLTPEGRKMADFVGSLRTSGQYSGWARGKEGAILDLEGNPVKGKKLSEFSFMTEWEKIDIEYTSRESTKEKLRREYEGVASDKLLDTIFRMIQFPYYGYNGDADRLKDAIEVIRKDYGVLFSESQLKKFIELYYSLNNHSNLWSNCGWTPDSLIKKEGRTRPSAITLGPNIRRMFETGELDLEEFKKAMRELGANLIE